MHRARTRDRPASCSTTRQPPSRRRRSCGRLIASRTSDTLSLTTGIDIEVRAASFRRLRGHTFIAAIADEAAFYFADESSANPDTEILNAVRPGLSTTNGLLAMISSPYAKRGELFEAHRRHYGPEGDLRILVAQGTSRDFNPSLPQAVVDRALERDHAAASAEFLAHESRVYSPENFWPPAQKDFCNNIGTSRT